MNLDVNESVILLDCIEQNRRYPDTFHIPTKDMIDNIKVGDYVKLYFCSDAEGTCAERMWVLVTHIFECGSFYGTLSNEPFDLKNVKFGDTIFFTNRHIMDTATDDDFNEYDITL